MESSTPFCSNDSAVGCGSRRTGEGELLNSCATFSKRARVTIAVRPR